MLNVTEYKIYIWFCHYATEACIFLKSYFYRGAKYIFFWAQIFSQLAGKSWNELATLFVHGTVCIVQSPYFETFLEPRNRFQGMNSASLCILAGRYDNPFPTRFLAPIDRARICGSCKETRYRFSAWRAGTKPYLSYWPARLHRLAKSIPRYRFLGSINVYKYGLCLKIFSFPLPPPPPPPEELYWKRPTLFILMFPRWVQPYPYPWAISIFLSSFLLFHLSVWQVNVYCVVYLGPAYPGTTAKSCKGLFLYIFFTGEGNRSPKWKGNIPLPFFLIIIPWVFVSW